MTTIATLGLISGSLRSDIETSILTTLDRSDLVENVSEWFNTAYREIQRLTNFEAAEFTTPIATITTDDVTTKVEAYTLTILPALLKNVDLVYTYDVGNNRLVKVYGKTSIQSLRVRRHETDELNPFLNSNSSPGVPSREWDNNLYALWSGRIELWPPVGVGQVGQELRMDGIQWLQPPANDQQDWFTINARDWLKYRALMESAPFLVDDPRLQTWQSFADRAKTTILGAEIEAQTSGENMQMRG